MASRRPLSLLIAIAIALATAACGGGSDDPEVTEGGASSTTVPGAADPAGSVSSEITAPVGAVPEGEPLPAADASGATTTGSAPGQTAPNGPGAGPEPDSLEPRRPAPGRYSYTGRVEEEEVRNELLVEQLEGSRQRHRTSEGSQGQIQEFDWRSSGVFLLREKRFRGAEESGDCGWEPVVPLLRFPLEQGRSWDLASTCAGGVGKPSLRQTGTARVTGTRVIDVGGRRITVAVVERDTEVTTVGLAVAPVQRRNVTELWSPKYGLLAQADGTGGSEVSGQRRESRFSFRLERLTPS